MRRRREGSLFSRNRRSHLGCARGHAFSTPARRAAISTSLNKRAYQVRQDETPRALFALCRRCFRLTARRLSRARRAPAALFCAARCTCACTPPVCRSLRRAFCYFFGARFFCVAAASHRGENPARGGARLSIENRHNRTKGNTTHAHASGGGRRRPSAAAAGEQRAVSCNGDAAARRRGVADFNSARAAKTTTAHTTVQKQRNTV